MYKYIMIKIRDTNGKHWTPTTKQIMLSWFFSRDLRSLVDSFLFKKLAAMDWTSGQSGKKKKYPKTKVKDIL